MPGWLSFVGGDAGTEALFHRVGSALGGWIAFWVAVDRREPAKNTSERLG